MCALRVSLSTFFNFHKFILQNIHPNWLDANIFEIHPFQHIAKNLLRACAVIITFCIAKGIEKIRCCCLFC